MLQSCDIFQPFLKISDPNCCLKPLSVLHTSGLPLWVKKIHTERGFPCRIKFRNFGKDPSFRITSKRSLKLLWLKSNDSRSGLKMNNSKIIEAICFRALEYQSLYHKV